MSHKEQIISDTLFRLRSHAVPLAMTITLWSLFLPLKLLLILLFSVFVHETGHLIAARLLGARGLRLDIHPLGFVISYEPQSLTAVRQAVAAAAGPASGMLFSLLLRFIPFGGSAPSLTAAARLSAALSVLNLLPLSFLDGGAIFRGILESRLLPDQLQMLCKWLDLAILIPWLLYGLYSAIAGGSCTPLFLPLTLLLFGCREMKNQL